MSERQVFVEIVRFSDGYVGKRMGPMSQRRADKVERGAMRNMDTVNWYTRQVEDKSHE
jgi:hypothetical protein